MNPDDITLVNTSQQFEYEKFSRELDMCEDIDELRQMCKFLMKVEMQTREICKIIVQDLSTQICDA